MKLYNTLSRKAEEVKPLNPPDVTVYTCGPTVYDYPHIGNWFTFLRYDVLVRALQAAGLKPKWVMNITDVGHLTSDADEGEDKLEVGAKREGKTAGDIAKKYSDYFVEGLSRLNIQKPDYLEKATDHIKEQIELIERLQKKGYTYVTRDGVYYDTSKFPSYSNLAKFDLAKLRPGARVVVNPEKKNPTDFALWKFSPTDSKRDMEWDSPWGRGFPGWHLECSAIAMKYLGETIDIHAGGIDHIPVHHTNEIAQSEAATGKPFVHYWMHSNFVLVNGQKMAKSLNNYYTLEDIEKKGFSLEAFRLLVLESHYRTEAEFSWEILEAAQNRLKSLEAMADLYWQPKDQIDVRSVIIDNNIETAKTVIITELNGDLNTPRALAMLEVLAANIKIEGLNKTNHRKFMEFLEWIDAVFGLTLSKRDDISKDQKTTIELREKARQAKNWGESDKFRKELESMGIGINDTEHGPIWYRL